MRSISLLFVFTLSIVYLNAQKKPLTHDVYDQWEALEGSVISQNGLYVGYEVNPQEGDGKAFVQSVDRKLNIEIPRGTAIQFTGSGNYAVVRIKAPFKETREGKIKKLTPAQMPKDSLAIIQLSTGKVEKIANFKAVSVTKDGPYIAYTTEIETPKETLDSAARVKKAVDSLAHLADSLKKLSQELATSQNIGLLRKPAAPATGGAAGGAAGRGGAGNNEAVLLTVFNTVTGKTFTVEKINSFGIDDAGKAIVYRINKNGNQPNALLWYDLKTQKADTILKEFNDVKNLNGFNKEATAFAFLVEQKAAAKGKHKTFEIFEYKAGQPKANIRVAANHKGIADGLIINENRTPVYSKSGKRLSFELVPVPRVKDTTKPDFEVAQLDIWHWQDQVLQTQQLLRTTVRGYQTFHYENAAEVLQIADSVFEMIIEPANNEDAPYGLATDSRKDAVASQWQGFSLGDVYLVDLKTGKKELLFEQRRGPYQLSPYGKFVYWYDRDNKKYFAYEIATKQTVELTKNINDQFVNEEYDNPDLKPAFGISTWYENDAFIVLNAEFDLWKIDPKGVVAPVNLTDGYGKQNNTELRWIRFERDEYPTDATKEFYFRSFNKKNKLAGVGVKTFGKKGKLTLLYEDAISATNVMKAKNAQQFLVTFGSVKESPNAYLSKDLKNYTKISSLNAQQNDYIWHTTELVKWTMFDGKESEGILYRPENFDSTKQYPVIFYFYEKNSDKLYNYNRPAPSASTINIAYFTSNGYIVFDPNIYYQTGQPGEDAYNSVVSAAEMLAKKPWVNAKKMAIQGQSWGGYQVTYLVTRTNMFAAAGAGAPVANMTSAYGGIRWGSGLVRQFQYEKGQSRIGKDLWSAFDDYYKNSPLFFAPKVETPLLIMHNDKDGAVPWYQGIEMFTALRRLGKPTWLLQYNNEDHNLVQRKNRKDLSIRLSQFFDHFLKDAPAPVWLKDGVPAKDKGYDFGFEVK
jgi:dienelactone hydrolase